MRPIFIFLLLVSLAFSSCNNSKVPGEVYKADPYAGIPENVQKVLEAHGGLEKWDKMNFLTYRLKRGDKNELHQIDLKSRKVRLEGGEWVIGFDGEEVWVSPDKASYGGSSARFYHNLIFYFYAMPFVLGDPGINYETLNPAEIKGKRYNKVRITFGENVGDAPDDEYILCFDPVTNQMEWLLYTVTYFSKEAGKKYNALHYNKWKEVNGLLLPEAMVGYKTSGDTITEKRYESFFEDIDITEKAVEQTMFEMPETAEIDSLK
jgi:hypothetical protein